VPEITDAELDAATEAYVRERWPQVTEWRAAYPAAFNETRERIRIALAAAAMPIGTSSKRKASTSMNGMRHPRA
jgi:hypothetical protein